MLWKVSAIAGICLIGVGIGAGYFGEAKFKFEFLSDHFEIFLAGLLLGIVPAFIGLIGWARQMNAATRRRVARMVFASPCIVGILGYPIDGFNIHGPSALLLLLIVPASILALVLAIM